MTKEADRGPATLPLGHLCVELVVQERLKYHVHVHQLLLTRLGKDQDVVAVHLHEASAGRGRRIDAWLALPVESKARSGLPKMWRIERISTEDMQ